MRTVLMFVIGFLICAQSHAQAPTRIEQNAVIFIEESDFGQAISAAILKKKVPVLVTTSRDKATFFLEEVSKLEKDSAAERVAEILGPTQGSSATPFVRCCHGKHIPASFA